MVFDFESGTTMGWGANSYPSGGRYGAAASWGATAGLNGTGGLITTGLMGGTMNWLGSSEYQQPSGPQNVYNATALTFDVRLDPNSAVDNKGGLGALRVFTQYATTPTRTDNNGYSQVWVFGDGSVGTGESTSIFTPGNWVHVSIPASLLGGSGSATDYWDVLNLICIGGDETYIGGETFTTPGNLVLDIDNVGFTSVPEPSSLLLGGLGTLAFALVGACRRVRRS